MSLVIDAKVLVEVLDKTLDIETRFWFMKMVRVMKTVVCARVGPKQKAQIIKMMKKDDPSLVTLAIGDGANDVSMILEAHIGIGIFGREGNRAADSSDVAIGQFKFLWQLIFKHGRWNYKRFSTLLNYFYYKNFVYTSMQIAFAFDNLGSMLSIFPEVYLTLFAVVFSQLPIFFYAIFELDVSTVEEKDGNKYKPYIPSLYFAGQRMLHFNSFVSTL